ncbi:MAG TPA: arsenate reductase ArsC [Candidatus Bathyarchaeia archaeon]|jgi:arsenate reductase|nr:arsenate reductase ArsC [Candidatus Bathyarchaeia archaeon]
MSAVSSPPVRILVLCTGNSCRSIMAEALFRALGGERVAVVSAGSVPAGAVNPMTERVLDEAGIDHGWARSKSMTEFLDREFDHVLTVCDDAAEACPVFPGPALRTHWSIPDPARASGTPDEILAVYRATLEDLRGRITAFLATLDE